MFNLILLIGIFGLIIAAFIMFFIDLLSYKKYQNKTLDKKFPKLSRNSVIMVLVALILLIFVSFSVVA
ncbi:MAG: hypothetical protein ACFE8V_11605 [Promethearchaeota archaeon]